MQELLQYTEISHIFTSILVISVGENQVEGHVPTAVPTHHPNA